MQPQSTCGSSGSSRLPRPRLGLVLLRRGEGREFVGRLVFTVGWASEAPVGARQAVASVARGAFSSSAPGGEYTDVSSVGGCWGSSATAPSAIPSLEHHSADRRDGLMRERSLLGSLAEVHPDRLVGRGDGGRRGDGRLRLQRFHAGLANASRMLSKFGVPSDDAVVLPKFEEASGS